MQALGARRWFPFAGLAVVLALGAATLVRPVAAQVAQCGAPSATVWAGTSEEEARLVSLTNAFRRQLGLSPLSVHSGLTAKARDWAARMAREGRIRHSELTVGVTANSLGAAENVGCDESVDGQHRAFLSSPVHRENLSEPAYTHVGVGLAHRPDGQLYTAEVFMAVAGGASGDPAPAPAAAASSPAPTPQAGTATRRPEVPRSSAGTARPSSDTVDAPRSTVRLVQPAAAGPSSTEWFSRLRGLDPSTPLLRTLRLLLQELLGVLRLSGMADGP
ncbi:MAG TPA: CAP domain-containing protein [Acidimicrobiales bacterium]|nr:CAP domain-containing protein [Acidimicrobiales bacterium]